MTAILRCILVKVLLEKWIGWVGYECAAKEWLRYRSNQFNSWAVIFLYIQRRKFFFYCSIKCHLGIFGLFGCFLKFSWIVHLVRNLTLFERRVILVPILCAEPLEKINTLWISWPLQQQQTPKCPISWNQELKCLWIER